MAAGATVACLLIRALLILLAPQAPAEQRSGPPTFRSEFRYAILSDDVDDSTGRRDLKRSVLDLYFSPIVTPLEDLGISALKASYVQGILVYPFQG